MTKDDLLALASRCESATGPDRELDAAIQLGIGYTLQRPAEPSRYPDRARWHDPDGVCLQWMEGDRCAPYPRDFTASIDAAMSLVPEGWFWRAGHSTLYDGWAGTNRVHPDHCDRQDETFAHGKTPALALCAASLRARANQEPNNG